MPKLALYNRTSDTRVKSEGRGRGDLQQAAAGRTDEGPDRHVDVRRAPLVAVEAVLVVCHCDHFAQNAKILLLLLLLRRHLRSSSTSVDRRSRDRKSELYGAELKTYCFQVIIIFCTSYKVNLESVREFILGKLYAYNLCSKVHIRKDDLQC